MSAQGLEQQGVEQRGTALRRQLWLGAFAVLALAHLAALYWPRVSVEGPVVWSDKVVHVLLFALPAAAGLLAGLRPAYLLVPLALHAPLSEALQHFVLPNRSGDVWDAVADLSGVVVGATVVRGREHALALVDWSSPDRRRVAAPVARSPPETPPFRLGPTG